jgi:hypothetical protein|tara:strand:- start:71348 stop:71611 length:264 start_codon:yes stop_codon:yes gene_type:complete
MFLAGYVFKPDHTEIHFMRNAKIDGRKKYDSNFTTEQSHAQKFESVEQFKGQLERFLTKANAEEDHYNFTLTYIELETNKITKVLTS